MQSHTINTYNWLVSLLHFTSFCKNIWLNVTINLTPFWLRSRDLIIGALKCKHLLRCTFRDTGHVEGEYKMQIKLWHLNLSYRNCQLSFDNTTQILISVDNQINMYMYMCCQLGEKDGYLDLKISCRISPL